MHGMRSEEWKCMGSVCVCVCVCMWRSKGYNVIKRDGATGKVIISHS